MNAAVEQNDRAMAEHMEKVKTPETKTTTYC